jgi:hypothetical protein
LKGLHENNALCTQVYTAALRARANLHCSDSGQSLSFFFARV